MGPFKYYKSFIVKVKSNWKGLLLWSNQFYGICAMSLATASTLVLLGVTPPLVILLFIHLSTVVFYTQAYFQENQEGIYNERAKWYNTHKRYLQIRQVVYVSFCVYLALFQIGMPSLFINASIFIKLFLLLTILISLLYYSPIFVTLSIKPYRSMGMLKSISIAWVWSIMTCVLPLWSIGSDSFVRILNELTFWVYFGQLFIYILILSILFDIKDLNRDKQELTNTIVIKYGVKKTLVYIIRPLLFLYMALFIIQAICNNYIFLNYIAQAGLVILTFSIANKVVKQKGIHINILMIDGLMIIKAILSIALFQMGIN